MRKMKKTLSILVLNHPGVLSRVAGLFFRRGFNIESLAVGETHQEGISRITIVTTGDEATLTQIKNQISKLYEVQAVRDYAETEAARRELVLVKISVSPASRAEVASLADVAGGRICDFTASTMTLALSDTAERNNTALGILEPYGIVELARTGTIALELGEGAIVP